MLIYFMLYSPRISLFSFLFILPLAEAAKEQRKKSKAGKPEAEAFREKLPEMIDLLHPSVVRFPSLLSCHDIHLDSATENQAINPNADADVAVKVMKMVKIKVKREPAECFRKFIECLQDEDSLYFEEVIGGLGQ